MAGSKSDYLENEILDHVLGGGDFTRPATVYLALFTVTPTDAGGGTEVTGGAYARVAVTNNATNFPAASGGSKSIGAQFDFPEATANWGTVVALGIFDASTAGWHSATLNAGTVTATFSGARGAKKYADVLVGNDLIVGINFGADYAVTAGTFTIQWASTGVYSVDLTP